MSAALTSNEPPSKLPDGANRRRTRVGLLVIWLVALGLRLWPIDHGMPANYIPDTHLVRSALGMAKDKNLVPEVGQYSTYPNLLAYSLLPVYAVEYAAGRATGQWGGAAEFGNYALEHPEVVHLPARIWFAFLASLLPLVAFGAARAMNLTVGAWVAAWLAATGLLGVHFSTQERPWEIMVLFMLLSTWPAARYVAAESRKALIWSCVAAAGAFGCHQGGGAALLIPAVAWALVFVRNRAELGQKAKALVVDGVLAVGLFAVVGVGLGHPYLLVHGATKTDQVVMGEELAAASGSISLGGQGFEPTFRLESFLHQGPALLSYDPVTVILGVLGFFVCWRRRCIWPALAFLVVWAGLFLFTSNDHVRYLLPLAGLLCLPAGAFVQRMHMRLSSTRATPIWFQGVLGVLMLTPLVQAARFAAVLGREDLRAIAARDMQADHQVLPQGARLAVDRYGPQLPLSIASLLRVQDVRALGSREAYRLAFLQALAADGLDPNDPAIGPVGGQGLDVLYLSDYLEFEDRDGTVVIRQGVAPELARDDFIGLLDDLGVTHVLLTDKLIHVEGLGLLGDKLGLFGDLPGHADSAGTPALVRAWLPTGTTLDATASQTELGIVLSSSDAAPIEARLPTELDDAWHTIWAVERPGPALYLFDRSKVAL